MTKLRDFIKSAGLRQSDVADRLGISRNYLSEIVTGRKPVGLRLAYEISVLTGGAIPMTYWLELEDQKKRESGESHIATPAEMSTNPDPAEETTNV